MEQAPVATGRELNFKDTTMEKYEYGNPDPFNDTFIEEETTDEKPESIIAMECQNIAEGMSAMQPTKEHFLYLYSLVMNHDSACTKFLKDAKRGDREAEEYYSNTFIKATGL